MFQFVPMYNNLKIAIISCALKINLNVPDILGSSHRTESTYVSKTLDRRYVPSYVRKYNIFSWEELARKVSIWWASGSQEVAKR